ncbi:hypothetical protein [Pseudonocardia hydrocarbonoxydans]|uniref:PPM-type phosphatase domain-containing protein n=1 Tax=Pseudonocardia hydrocarbonoxydans TaxID=76726 RepID=A0A4Y3WXM6_9PSEU|nr:hypothetical protein [Pseudonocardia hydrocarbonoxydans]GEC22870.1 hypothetical protein PHY01_51530 [Pseudonocardia hydrocarbonoxydans]
MKVHTATLAGGASNADRVFVTDHSVIVLDGATAFAPVDVDPGTYAGTLGHAIAERVDQTPDIATAVAEAIRATTLALHLDNTASPSSTVAVLRARTGHADLYVLGDSPIYYGTAQQSGCLTDSRLAALPLAERGHYKAALTAGAGYNEQHRDTLTALQRAQRLHRNVQGGYWIAETDPEAAHHGLTVTLTAADIEWAVLATDGAADVISHHEKPAWSEIAHYDDDALSDLLHSLHRWEADHDPHGQLLPRSKLHDDKTVAAVPAVF